MRTHKNIRLAHVLVDDYVSQVMDMEMSNQLYGNMCGHVVGLIQYEKWFSFYAMCTLCP